VILLISALEEARITGMCHWTSSSLIFEKYTLCIYFLSALGVGKTAVLNADKSLSM
jgi:hypothetical protein